MKKPSRKPTLLGAPISGSANALTALEVTVNAPVPGATATRSGVGDLLLRAQKTFSVPVSEPVRAVSAPVESKNEAFPLHAAYSELLTSCAPRNPVNDPEVPNRVNPGFLRQTTAGGANPFLASTSLPMGPRK